MERASAFGQGYYLDKAEMINRGMCWIAERQSGGI